MVSHRKGLFSINRKHQTNSIKQFEIVCERTILRKDFLKHRKAVKQKIISFWEQNIHGEQTGWRNFLKFQLILMGSVDILLVWNYLGFKDIK